MKVKISESIMNEALKPSEFRNLMNVGRGIARKRINKIWPRLKKMADFTNRSGDRLYFNIEQSNDLEIPSKNEIVNFLSNNNYDIVDFSKGFVKKEDDKNIIRLGKVLTMIGKSDKTALDLLQKYNNEKSLLTKTGEEYFMVISRHPYDIGSMATGRNWRSCMNLRGGEDRHYVEIDIELGTIISYLVEKNDKNIQDPISRVLIKPYLNQDDLNDVLYGIEHDYIKHGLDNKNYFKKLISVLDKAQEKKTGIFEIDKELYNDTGGKPLILKINNQIKKDFESKIKELKDGLTFEILFRRYPWLFKKGVSFKDAILGLGVSDKLEWYGGIWENGVWEGGVWVDGVWKKGIWNKGTWKNGIWENGIWASGLWKNGIWKNGDWENGSWENGVWRDGTWTGGSWKNGTWEKGHWKSGYWEDGVWKGGYWEDGRWENGTWKGGNWEKGIWKGGEWEEGKIYDKKTGNYIESQEPPK
jgi:hypothetical protein